MGDFYLDSKVITAARQRWPGAFPGLTMETIMDPTDRPDTVPETEHEWDCEARYSTPPGDDALTVALVESATEVVALMLNEPAAAGYSQASEQLFQSARAVLQKAYDGYLRPPPELGGPVELDDDGPRRVAGAMAGMSISPFQHLTSHTLLSPEQVREVLARTKVCLADEGVVDPGSLTQPRAGYYNATTPPGEGWIGGQPPRYPPDTRYGRQGVEQLKAEDGYTCQKCLQPTPTLYAYEDPHRHLQVCLKCLRYLTEFSPSVLPELPSRMTAAMTSTPGEGQAPEVPPDEAPPAFTVTCAVCGQVVHSWTVIAGPYRHRTVCHDCASKGQEGEAGK